MNFKSGPVKRPAFQQNNQVVQPQPTPEALPQVPGAGPAKRFPGIRGMIGKK